MTTPAGALSNPLLLVAQSTITQRPAVMYTYALFSSIPEFSLYRDGYVFLLVTDFLIFSSVYFVARNFVSKRSKAHILLSGAIAAAAAGGFYGQLAFDINAWSAFLATPMLTVGAWCIVSQILRRSENTEASVRDPLIVGALLAAAFIVYPEGATVFGVSLVLTGLLAFIMRPGLRSWGFPYALWACGSATITVIICQGQSLVEFLVFQQQNPAVQAPTWWTYFDQYMFGYDPRFIDVIARGLSPNAAATSIGISLPHYILSAADSLLLGTLGVYFLNDSPFGEINVPVVLSLIVASAWLMGLALWLVRTLRSTEKSRYLSFTLFLAIFLAINFSFVIRHEYWAAGKVLLWIFPLLVVALCSPLLLYRASSRVPRILLPITLIWLLVQLGFASTWPLAASTANGFHRAPPYPAVQDVSLKTGFNWNIDQVASELSECPTTIIDASNMWVRHYVLMATAEAGSRPVLTNLEDPYFFPTAAMGPMSLEPGRIYCRITQAGISLTKTRHEMR
jgi:hypothetical protein